MNENTEPLSNFQVQQGHKNALDCKLQLLQDNMNAGKENQRKEDETQSSALKEIRDKDLR